MPSPSRGSKKGARCAVRASATPIVLLEGVFNAAQLAGGRTAGLRARGAQSGADRVARRAAPARTALRVWLKIDTGMNRLGFRIEEFPAALCDARLMPARLRHRVRVLTHLASADVM